MNSKERLLNSIKGLETDRLAWSPFLAYFWDMQPESLRKKGMLDFYKSVGADPLFRGYCTLIKKSFKNCTITENVSKGTKQVLYTTPVGELEARYTYTPQGNTWFMTQHPVRSSEDYKALIYLNEDMTIEPDFSKYNAGLAAMGDEALLMPIISSEMKSSFQALLEKWVGTEQLTYDIYDYPEVMEECLEVMKGKSKIAAQYAAQCDAESFIFWEDSSTGNLSPSFFRDYIADELNMWADILHDNDKYLIHHACGQLKGLIPEMSKTGIDMIESISPPPTGDIYTYEAREMLPDHIGLIGGIEPTVLLNYNMDKLADYVTEVVEKTGKKRFILGNSDSCPPGVEIEKFKMISQLVREI